MAQEHIQMLSREEVRRLQMERLQVTLNRAYFNVDFYRKRMDSLNIFPEDISTLPDFHRFPFTTRRDLADHYPYGLFAAPLRSIVRLKVTNPVSQGQGKPIVVGFTRHDVSMWQDLMCRLLEQLSVNERDIVQVAFNFSLFPGAFTFNQAAESIGATLAPSATISAILQLQIMLDFHSTVLATTSSFALHIAETMEQRKQDPRELHLRMILIGPEPLSHVTRERIESVFRVPVYGLYGVPEMIEPGMAGECSARDGLHLAEDQFLAEVVDPITGIPQPPGREGELVLTTLTAEAYPLIRYRTGDITVVNETRCPCGHIMARITPVLRRTDNRVTVRGIPFYPEDVEELLRDMDPLIEDFRLIVHTCFGVGDHLELLIARAAGEDLPFGGKSQYLDHLRGHLRRMLGIGTRIQVTDLKRLPKEGLTYKTVFRSDFESKVI